MLCISIWNPSILLIFSIMILEWGNLMISTMPVKQSWRIWALHRMNALRTHHITGLNCNWAKVGERATWQFPHFLIFPLILQHGVWARHVLLWGSKMDSVVRLLVHQENCSGFVAVWYDYKKLKYSKTVPLFYATHKNVGISSQERYKIRNTQWPLSLTNISLANIDITLTS